MPNLVRLVACVAIVVGLLGEISLGLLLPSRIKLQYPTLQASHLVQVDLPPVEQAAQWCMATERDNHPGGQFIDCSLRPSR